MDLKDPTIDVQLFIRITIFHSMARTFIPTNPKRIKVDPSFITYHGLCCTNVRPEACLAGKQHISG